MKKSFKSSLLHALAASILVGMPMHQAQSAPGTLPTSPLYLSTIVEPNVFLTLDDSGSMGWGYWVSVDLAGLTNITIDDGSLARVGLAWLNGTYRNALNPYWLHTSVVPPASGPVGSNVLPEAWVFRSHEANKTYYNPAIDYDPWPGTDASGNDLYCNIRVAPTLACETNIDSVPLYTSSFTTSPKINLIADYNFNDLVYYSTKYYLPTYYETSDSNGNGVIDAGDSHTLVEIRPTSQGGPATYSSGRDYTGEIENFANWWVYHRNGELSTKSVIGKIINNSDSNRMGLSVFNGGHKIDAATMSDPANKLALLTAFYAAPSSGTTPARRALENVGLMFAGEGSAPSPILPSSDGGTCQQNFNILMTDGYWNGPGPTWGTQKPKDTNNTDVDSVIATSDFDGDASQSNDGGNYADAYIDTLADVAMHYYETDLSALVDEVPVRKGIDQATHQHLVNYTVSFGLEGSLDQSIQPTNLAFAGWPEPVAGTQTTIDDLWHAAYNSRGSNIFVQNSAELESELNLTIGSITEATGTVTASVAVNSAKLSTSSTVYLATFFSDFWNGDLSAFLIEDLDTGKLKETSEWKAANKLTARIAAFGHDNANRPIITYDSATGKGVPFTWADRTPAMEADFNTSPGAVADAQGEKRLNFIRGDRDFEGTDFRVRGSLLGDIVNSSPVYVGPPNLAWPDTAPFPTGPSAYSTFKEARKTRDSVLYVGANDGMLHAFKDDGNNDPTDGIQNGGEEIFAYIPGLLYSSGVANKGLHYLSDPNYIHNYYVDLTPSVSDIYFSTGSWRTVLVGGLRGGGRGLYALDITNPAAFGADATKADQMSLWEFTSAQDADLGYTFARPTIGLSNAGTWVAIFGNGYNHTGTGEASLFIVEIEKGIDGWSAGEWTKISTGVGTPGAQNGLAAPALADLDGNGTIDRAYAGDLEGNMWAFDLSGSTKGSWSVAGKSGLPLFTNPANQPITAKPVLASHPTQPDDNTNAPNIMVYFGTGQYLVSGDKVTTHLQSFYGVWDDGTTGLDNTSLIKQEFDSNFGGRVLTRNPIDYSIDHGWYFNLTDSGERAVTTPIARADTVFFNTFVPSDAACDRGGYGYRFAVDMATGGSPLVPTIDSNGDGLIDDKDYQSNGIDQSTLAAVRQEGFLPEPVFIEDLAFTGSTASKIKSLSTVPSGRFSWQELLF